MKEILDIIHKTIYQFFDVCEDDKEVPMSDKDKLLLEVNKAICNNLKALEQEPERKTGKWHVEGFNVWCTNCGFHPTAIEVFNYCPNCGAKMEVDE